MSRKRFSEEQIILSLNLSTLVTIALVRRIKCDATAVASSPHSPSPSLGPSGPPGP